MGQRPATFPSQPTSIGALMDPDYLRHALRASHVGGVGVPDAAPRGEAWVIRCAVALCTCLVLLSLVS